MAAPIRAALKVGDLHQNRGLNALGKKRGINVGTAVVAQQCLPDTITPDETVAGELAAVPPRHGIGAGIRGLPPPGGLRKAM